MKKLPCTCQLQVIEELCNKSGIVENFHHLLFKKMRKFSIKLNQVRSKLKASKNKLFPSITSQNLQDNLAVTEVEIEPNDLVRVRSEKEIRKLLNQGRPKCPFMKEMFKYCGGEYRVVKKVNYFFDDNLKVLCRVRGVYLLETSICQGSRKMYLKKCNLNCFFFWHKDWLERI